MSLREERALAARLARALDGERPEQDVEPLVAVLEQATEPARFEVTADEVERALARTRPRLERPRRDRRAAPRLAVAFGAVAVAAVAVLVFTFVRVSGVDVEGKALAAISPTDVLEIVERIEPAVPGAFPTSTRTVWIDSRAGLTRTVQTVRGRTIEETLAGPGRFSRYLPGLDLLIIAPSCRGFASGCADLVDPVAFYRRALQRDRLESAKRDGGVYRLAFRAQTLPDAVRIEQQVTIDADTFLPKLIEWREQRRGGSFHDVSRIVIERIQKLSREEFPDPFHLSTLDSTRVVHRTDSRVPVRELERRTLTTRETRTVRPPLLAVAGERPQLVEEIRWNAGTAYRLDYGPMTVWNYRSFLPPQLFSAFRSGPAKVVPLGRNVARFYMRPRGGWLVEVDTSTWSVAITAPEEKIDILHFATQLAPLG